MPILRDIQSAWYRETSRWRAEPSMPRRPAISPAVSEQARRAYETGFMQDSHPTTMESIESIPSPAPAEVEHDLRYFINARKSRAYKLGDYSKLFWTVVTDYTRYTSKLVLGRYGKETQEEAIKQALDCYASDRASYLREMNKTMTTIDSLNKTMDSIKQLASQ